MFNEAKVAQMAAYLLSRRGGQMSYLKLMKLLYLADRTSMDRFDEPMTDDAWVSMNKGPVLSNVLELMQGGSKSGVWNHWVSEAPVRYEVSLACQEHDRECFDELSDADIDVLDAVWQEFGHLTRWQLVDYTHEHCPEWHDPRGSMRPIRPQDIFQALGRSDEEADELSSDIFQRRELKQVMERLA